MADETKDDAAADALNDDRTLWATPDRSRFFLVPDDLELSPGDLVLETATRQLEVDPAAAAPFEVSGAEADAWIETAGRRAFEKARDAFQELWGEAKDALKRKLEPAAAPKDAGTTVTGLLSSLLGITPDQLKGDTGAVAAGLRSVARGVADVMQSALSTDPLVAERAHARLFALREALKAQGVDPGPELETLPDRWRASWQSPEVEQSLRDGAERLREMAARTDGKSAALEQTLEDGAAELTELAERVREARTGEENPA